MMSDEAAPQVTLPLVGRVGAEGAGVGVGGTEQRPPSLTLPHKGGGNRPPLWRRLRLAVAVACSALVCTLFAAAWWVHSLGPVLLGQDLEFSTLVVDREDRLLRPYATADGRWRLPLAAASADPRYLDALISYEDK